MLYRENPANVFTPWTGDPINDVRYPPAIETLWSAADLATLGLYMPVDPGVPFGRAVVSQSAQRINGVVTLVYDLAAPTAGDVWAEKDRRWALGFDYDFGDARGVHRIATTPKDLDNWKLVSMGANALIALGQSTQTIDIYTETSGTTPVSVTALEWQQIVIAATSFIQLAMDKAAALIATPGGIPADYTDDSHWT